MYLENYSGRLITIIISFGIVFISGCNIVKTDKKTATLLKTENATQQQLVNEVNRFARVDSMRAKVDVKFEDNSFAQFGSKEVYRTADGEIVVQRPSSIRFTIQVPVIKTDVAQMSSDGKQFRVAILQDGGSGKYKRFVIGSNQSDYTLLRKEISSEVDNGEVAQNVNAFANIRPQHFTDALLVKPIDADHLYATSTTYQIEENPDLPKKNPLKIVNRGYYLLDEFSKGEGGSMLITRRFWFDRVGGIRLARQQIFDTRGEIETDIVYGQEGKLTDTNDYPNLPLQVIVTRPQEKYAVRLTYKLPDTVVIGQQYPERAFVLQNTWQLQEVDLDKRLEESKSTTQGGPAPPQ